MRARTAGRIIGATVKAGMAEYDRIEAARPPAEKAARLAAADRDLWMPLAQSGPNDMRTEAGPDYCARCGEHAWHRRRQGLCVDCMKIVRRKIRAARAAGAAP